MKIIATITLNVWYKRQLRFHVNKLAVLPYLQASWLYYIFQHCLCECELYKRTCSENYHFGNLGV